MGQNRITVTGCSVPRFGLQLCVPCKSFAAFFLQGEKRRRKSHDTQHSTHAVQRSAAGTRFAVRHAERTSDDLANTPGGRNGNGNGNHDNVNLGREFRQCSPHSIPCLPPAGASSLSTFARPPCVNTGMRFDFSRNEAVNLNGQSRMQICISTQRLVSGSTGVIPFPGRFRSCPLLKSR